MGVGVGVGVDCAKTEEVKAQITATGSKHFFILGTLFGPANVSLRGAAFVCCADAESAQSMPYGNMRSVL